MYLITYNLICHLELEYWLFEYTNSLLRFYKPSCFLSDPLSFYRLFSAWVRILTSAIRYYNKGLFLESQIFIQYSIKQKCKTDKQQVIMGNFPAVFFSSLNPFKKLQVHEANNHRRSSKDYVIPPKYQEPVYCNKNSKKEQREKNIRVNQQIELYYFIQSKLQQIRSLIYEGLQFDELWSKFQNLLRGIIVFKAMFPWAANQVGHQIVRNGSFLVLWLRILQKNPCINIQMVCKKVRQKYLAFEITQKLQIEDYLKSKEEKKEYKQMQNQIRLKRNENKYHEKKVQFMFDKDELSEKQQVNLIRQNKVQLVRSKYGIVIDYFEINDIYFLNEVQIVAVLEECDNEMAIFLARTKDKKKEIVCIGAISTQVKSKQFQFFKKVQKQYQNLCFLELEGKRPGELWVDSLQAHKRA